MLKTWRVPGELGKSFCEEIHVWPVRLELPGGGGCTLWGDALRGDDILLAAANRLVLAPTIAALIQFVLAEPSVNFLGRHGYDRLRAALSDGAQFASTVATLHALAALPAWIRADPDDWTHSEISNAINTLNMAWDVGRTIHDPATVASLKRGGGPLGEFVDALYEAAGILDEPHDIDFVTEFDLDGLADELDAVLARIENRTHRL